MTMVKAGLFISERYEIIANIGSGGTADVYKAKDHRLNRFVAIKILRRSFTGDSKIVAKFRQEAQSCAGLTHPNIVSVYDVGNDGDLHYIVMELIEGITLKKFIEKKGRLEIKEAVGIAIQIAQGLDAAHANHVVHRDIKPQNIIISREGKVKVTDFGIARATFGTSSNTINQAPVGSVHYLSPEQARGGFSDERSDIYSLGVTIYEMLSGRVPFTGDNNVSVALLHIQGEAAPLHELNPEVTPSIEKIVAKCMQKKPERRYFSAAELIKDLKAAMVNPSGDFVKIATPRVSNSPTINMTDAELREIKNQTHTEPSYNDYDDYDNEPEEIMDDDDELDPVNTKKEKIIIISMICVVLLFLGVIIYFVASKFELFGGNSDPGVVETTKLSNADIVKLMAMDYTLEELQKELKDNYNISDFITKPKHSDTVESGHIISIYYESDSLVVEISSGAQPVDTVEMPDVRGKDLAEATRMLKALSEDFTIFSRASEENTDNPVNEVIDQSIEAGTDISFDSEITLIYSIGPEQLVVPDVSTYTKSMLETQFGEQFTFKYEYDVENDYPTNDPDVVVRTDPEIGSPIKKGDTLTVYLSSTYVYVPSVTGKTEGDAKAALEAKGFKVSVTESYSSTVTKGCVVSQELSEGASVQRGSTVSITISKGAEPTVEPPKPTAEPEPTVTQLPDEPDNTPTPSEGDDSADGETE